MKTLSAAVLLLFSVSSQSNAQVAAASASSLPSPVIAGRVVERGPNHKLVEVARATTNQLGQAVQTTNLVTVLGQGMHFKDASSGQWIESQPVIQSYAGGIICTGASYRVILNQNLHQSGSVDLQAADGERVVSHPLAIYFYDPESGKSLLLAQLQDCRAELSTNNTVIYRNAFAAVNNSGVQAAVTYRYEAGRWSQDVTLTTKPAITPKDVGLGSKTRLEVASEIESSPTVAKEMHNWRIETNALIRAAMAEPDVVDETLTFGPELTMTLGRAFATESTPNRRAAPGLPVAKRLVQAEGRTLLLESLEWNSAKNELDKLPTAPGSASTTNLQARLSRELPQMTAAQNGNSTPTARISFETRLRELSRSASSTDTLVAANRQSQSTPVGFVVDYPIYIGQYENNRTFYGGSTYVVQSFANICNATFEPGTVIKFGYGASLYLTCSLNFQSGGCPIVFTAVDDNSVGEPIGSGSPSGYYADYAMYCYYFNPAVSAGNIDVRYAANGLYCYLNDFTLLNSRFMECGVGAFADSCNIYLDNIGMVNTSTWWDVGGWGAVYPGYYICEDCDPLIRPNVAAVCRTVMVGKNAPDSLTFQLSALSACNGSPTFATYSAPSHAQTFSLPPSGFCSYKPVAGYAGDDSFLFVVNDGGGNSDPAPVVIHVTPGPTLSALGRPTSIALTWDMSAVEQLYGVNFVNAGFKVSRRTTPGGTPEVITPTPLPSNTSTYLDTSAVPGTPYYYYVTFLHTDYDCLGHPTTFESPASNQVGPLYKSCPSGSGLWADKGPTALQLAQWIMGPNVTVSNARYNGSPQARGIFGGGSTVGLNGHTFPLDHGVILSSGDINDAVGPNDDWAGSQIPLDYPGDSDLTALGSGSTTYDAAVLEFDFSSTSSFQLQIQYVFGSEEYPQFIGEWNDPMAIFVSTTTSYSINNDLALVPNTVPALPINVHNINGGLRVVGGTDVQATNPQYYVDNHDPNDSALPQYAASSPVYNIQYDGATVLLAAQMDISANTIYHTKIAVADYADGKVDSAVFLETKSFPCQ